MKNVTWKHVIIAIVTLLSGSFIGHITGFWQSLIDREDSYIKKHNDSLRENGELRLEIEHLKNALTLLNIADFELPFPIEVIDNDGDALYVNNSYEDEILKQFGSSKLEYIGTDVGSFLNDSLAVYDDSIDLQVIKSGMVVRVIDVIPSPGEQLQKAILYKFPVIFNGKVEFVGGAWIALEEN